MKNAKSPIADEIEGWNAEFYDTFIKEYLQQKPLLIRNAFPNIEQMLQLDTDDFFELAADDDVDTRMFRKSSEETVKEYGPFPQSFLRGMPPANWSILVQEVDRHIPRVADLWSEGFDFIPSWRRDDIMISYSLPGGSIGAHVDNYDVFLLQGSGVREWAIENEFLTEREEKKREVPNIQTRLLRDFRIDQKWKMHPGDMLYLPPRIPHQGTTLQGPCTTISIGFRAPNYQSLVTALWEEVCSKKLNDDNSFFIDEGTLNKVPSSPTFLSHAARNRFKDDAYEKMNMILNDDEAYTSWIGKYLTTPLRFRLRRPRAFFLESEANNLLSLADEVSEHDEAVDDGEWDEEDPIYNHSDIEVITVQDVDSDEEEQLYDEEDDDVEDIYDDIILPFAIRNEKHRYASMRQYPDAEALLVAVLKDECSLRRFEGVRMTYTEQSMFIDGEEYYLPKGSLENNLPRVLCDSQYITAETLLSTNMIHLTKHTAANRFLCGLLRSGFYYPVNKKNII